MNQPHVHPSRGPSSAAVGAERFSAIRPEPSSRASTSLSTNVSDIASELSHFSPSMGTYTPSPPDPSASSNNIFHSQDATRLPERSTSQLPGATFPTYVSRAAAGSPSLVARTSSAVQTPPLVSSAPVSPPPPPPPPIPPRITGPVTPAPAHRHTHSRSQSQTHSQLQSHQLGAGSQAPPSSARSKVSVAETPSGDLANFHLLKGSPLQSIADFDTPTPSPRTPSMPSVSPADAQAFALAIANGGGGYLPPLAADHRRFLPGSSVSPSVSRAQRAAAGHRSSSFYCRICQADPCHDITATACGHVFCNVCIVEEVRENARCPVCNAAVLLFALLKLDLS
jgi:hypothetical protein